MKIHKILLVIFLSLFFFLTTIITSLYLFVFTTPNMLPFYLRQNWINIRTYEPYEYNIIKDDITVVKDVLYDSKFKQNTLDIYYSNNIKTPKKTVLWVHGGGFVTGDKSRLKVFASLLAKEGFTVVSMNYALSPEECYPSALIQLNEAIDFLNSNSEKFKQVNTNDLFLGGDSAGAHIVANYASIYSDINRSNNLGIKNLDINIKGLLLYCGPYALNDFENMVRSIDGIDERLLKFFVNQIGYAYLGSKYWYNSPNIRQTDILNIVDKDFPPTYITDGNSLSFLEQAICLSNKLKSVNVYVKTYFPSYQYNGDFIHEYQFDFKNYPKQAFENLNHSINFINSINN